MTPNNCLIGVFDSRIIQLLQEMGLVDAAGVPICNCGSGTGSGDCSCTIVDILGDPGALDDGVGVYVENGQWVIGPIETNAADVCCDFDMIYSAPCCLTDFIESAGQTAPNGGAVDTIEIIGDSPAPNPIVFSIADCISGGTISGPYTVPQGSTVASIPVNIPTGGQCWRIRILSGLGTDGDPCWRATFQLSGTETP